MRITFDPAKDAANVRKHALSLSRAHDFDFDAACFDIDDSQDYGEVRWNAVGFLDEILYTLTFTDVDGDLRAIRLRRASTEEAQRYAEEF